MSSSAENINILDENNKLQDQLSLWHFMSNEERTIFIKDVRSLVFAAREIKRIVKDKSTKTQLTNIIKIWNEFLKDIKKEFSHELGVISRSSKISPAPAEISADEGSMTQFIRSMWYYISRPIKQPLSHHKVTANSPLPIPHNPKSRAIFDKLYGTIDSTGRSE